MHLDLSLANRRHVNAIANRLSLRDPQRMSLEILARVTEIVPLDKAKQDLGEALRVVRSEFGGVTDFERDFPSLAFALATGVGKTRLMGAFAAYLHRAHGVMHFFVLAPNLTIYDKLKADFTPGSAKYVFQGLSEFAAAPPLVITGENYASSLSTRTQDLLGRDDRVHINVFNISKLSKDAKSPSRGREKGSVPRIKRLSEYIGQSYFDYLAGLDDLVLLMDESHRYRAEAGVKVLNELRPVLGLELTATPQVEKGTRATPFENVIYRYPLADAIRDGYVKEPAVGTRENFDPKAHTPESLERVKLEDAMRLHEDTKVKLDTYARQTEQPRVKPFVLVVAADTTHADGLQRLIDSDAFLEGRYRGRAITVHSNQRGEEKEETIQRLLQVEDPEEPTEIVIHVNKLKEGWDVTNLYTIVPLRAANSTTLIEQSIGRGLRLPYGKKTGVPAVDRLTIVSHDRFREIVDAANDPNSVLRQFKQVVIQPDAPGTEAHTVLPTALGGLVPPAPGSASAPPPLPGGDGTAARPEAAPPLFTGERAEIAKAILEAIDQTSGRLNGRALPHVESLATPEAQKALSDRVMDGARAYQLALGMSEAELREEVGRITEAVTSRVVEGTISIPRITTQPELGARVVLDDFDLDPSAWRYQPVEQRLLVRHLQSGVQERLRTGAGHAPEDRLESHLVRHLRDFPDVDYHAQSMLVQKLAGQAVAHFRSYLPDEEAVRNVVRFYERTIAENIHAQMQPHIRETATRYEATVHSGYQRIRPLNYTVPEGETVRHYSTPVATKQAIRSMHFGGFARCLYPVQKFDSDPERAFAQLLESDPAAERWFRPVSGQFQIYLPNDRTYQPDFVVEAKHAKYLVEVKARNQMEDEDVQAKATAARAWCGYASTHAQEHGGKPWRYLLIPADVPLLSATLHVLQAKYGAD